MLICFLFSLLKLYAGDFDFLENIILFFRNFNEEGTARSSLFSYTLYTLSLTHSNKQVNTTHSQHIHTDTDTHSLSHTLTHSHTHTLTHSHTHTRAHSHAPTHTLTHSHTFEWRVRCMTSSSWGQASRDWPPPPLSSKKERGGMPSRRRKHRPLPLPLPLPLLLLSFLLFSF